MKSAQRKILLRRNKKSTTSPWSRNEGPAKLASLMDGVTNKTIILLFYYFLPLGFRLRSDSLLLDETSEESEESSESESLSEESSESESLSEESSESLSESEEELSSTSCFCSMILFGAVRRCSRSSSVSPPKPMEVKKLMAKRVFLG